MSRFVTFLFCLIATSVVAQDKTYPSIDCDFKLPTPLGNPAFRKTTDGIADASVSFQVPVFKGIGIGVGYAHLFTKVNEATINIQNVMVNGSMHRMSPFASLHYKKFLDEQFIFETGLKVGYSYFQFNSIFLERESRVFKAESIFLEPYIGISVLAQENFSISLVAAYSYSDFAYGPQSLGMEFFPGFLAQAHKGPTHVLSIGFGFSAFLRGIKKRR